MRDVTWCEAFLCFWINQHNYHQPCGPTNETWREFARSPSLSLDINFKFQNGYGGRLPTILLDSKVAGAGVLWPGQVVADSWRCPQPSPQQRRRGGTNLITSSISYNEARTGCGWRGRRGPRDQMILKFINFDVNIFSLAPSPFWDSIKLSSLAPTGCLVNKYQWIAGQWTSLWETETTAKNHNR